MAAITYLGKTSNSVSGTHSFTGTPALNSLIVIVTIATDNTSTATCTDDNSSGTYTLINSATNGSSAHKMTLQIRDSLIPANVSTIFSHAPGTSTGGAIIVYQVTGMSVTGASAAVQSQIQSNQAAATPAPVLGATPRLSSPIIGAIINTTSTTAASMTERTGYTEDIDSGWGVPTTGFETMHRDSGETSATITWGSASSTGFADVVVELDGTSTTTKTQTGISRIQIVTAKTQTGVSRVTATTVKTQTGVARITATATKAQAGKSRITVTTQKAQLGVSNITSGLVQKTQTGISKINTTAIKTQLGLARITKVASSSQTGMSRITAPISRTQTGKAAIFKSITRDQAGKSSILIQRTKTQTGVARVAIGYNKIQTGISRIIFGFDFDIVPDVDVEFYAPVIKRADSTKPTLTLAAED